MSFLRRWFGEEDEALDIPVISRKGKGETQSPAEAASREGEETPSYVGSGISLEGTLQGRGVIRLNGVFRGTVRLQGTFIVGPQGKAELDMCEAQVVVVEGLLKGPVRAVKVVLKAGGRLYGDVVTQSLEAESGGYMQGRVQTEDEVQFSWEPQPDTETPSAPPR